MAYAQMVMAPCRDASLLHAPLSNCVSAGSARNVRKAMKACASGMFNIYNSLPKRARKSETRISSVL